MSVSPLGEYMLELSEVLSGEFSVHIPHVITVLIFSHHASHATCLGTHICSHGHVLIHVCTLFKYT